MSRENVTSGNSCWDATPDASHVTLASAPPGQREMRLKPQHRDKCFRLTATRGRVHTGRVMRCVPATKVGQVGINGCYVRGNGCYFLVQVSGHCQWVSHPQTSQEVLYSCVGLWVYGPCVSERCVAVHVVWELRQAACTSMRNTTLAV